MKKLTLFIGIMLVAILQSAHAQDIFKQHGFEKEPLTLSNGSYNEFFDNEEVVQIGSVLLNTRTYKIAAFVEEDTTKTKYLAENSSRWLSIDPLAAKYSQVSPYVYCINNPIKFVDPDGRDIIVLNNTKGANVMGMNFGHMAVLIGNDKAGWTYVSKDGRAQSTNPNDRGQDGTLLGGGKSTQTIKNDGVFKTLEGALGSDLVKGFDQGFRIETSADQDAKATSVATESAKSDYNVITSNCADVATDALESTGKNGGTIDVAVEIGTVVKTRPVAPNDRFDAIVYNNKGTKIEMQKKDEQNK
jgi:hypothetical protein